MNIGTGNDLQADKRKQTDTMYNPANSAWSSFCLIIIRNLKSAIMPLGL